MEELPVPAVRRGMVLVRTSYSFISSGTESATVTLSGRSIAQRMSDDFWHHAAKLMESLKTRGIKDTISLVRGSLDRLLEVGYSCSGCVEAAGPDAGVVPGDFVACAGAGFAVHGEYVVVPHHLVVKLSDANHLREVSIAAIAAVALQGFRRSECAIGEEVVVLGLGLVGLLTVQIARAAGCSVIGIDLDPSRIVLGEQLGCIRCFNAADPELEISIGAMTNGRGVDSTIVCAASSTGAVLDRAMKLTRRRGKVVLVGDVRIDVAREEFYRKEIDLRISCSYGPGRYDHRYEREGLDYPYDFVRWTEHRNLALVVSMIEQGKLQVAPLVSREFALKDANVAYDCLVNDKPLGVLLTYSTPAIISRSVISTVSSAPKRHIGVAVIGAGGFTQSLLLPALSAIPAVALRSLVAPTGANLLSVARRFGINWISTDYREVLRSDAIDAVVIATPHGSHVGQVCEALQAGKAVFVEKPAAISDDQLKRLEEVLDAYPNLPFMVDFNRSHAPMIRRVIAAVRVRSTPLMITYRMNVGLLPDEHWVFAQGGRIIGEACHIFELFLSLVAVEPVSLSVHAARGESLSADNVVIALTFADGSVAQLIYTSLGNQSLSKERMECFWEGKSMVMDDFSSLTSYGVYPSCSLKSRTRDKGHVALIESFFSTITVGRPRDAQLLARTMLATRISLLADHLARTGQTFARV